MTQPVGELSRAARTAHLHADAVAALTAYPACDSQQERLRADYLAHLSAHPDGVIKGGPPAHLTASCLVLDDRGEQVLLTLHRRAGLWLQFGGHLELSDDSVYAAAVREGREESGLGALTVRPEIVELNRHTLAGDFGRCREHLDIRYVALVEAGTAPTVSEESHDVRWWPVAALPAQAPPDVSALISAARRLIART